VRLQRLIVSQLGAVARAELTLGPGLSVLHGPNDRGKSTLAQAIRMALLLPATSKGADGYRSWHGGGPPTVEATFELGPQQLVRVTKEFSGPRGTAKLESSRDGRTFHEEHTGRAVDGELRRLLRWGIPEPGGAGGQHGLPTSYLATALLGPQDPVVGVLGADLDEDRDTTGRDRVAAALQALARDPRFVGVLAETQARYEAVWTATGNLRRVGRLKDVSDDVLRAERAADAQRALVAGTEQVRSELELARAEAGRARAAFEHARAALAEVERREAAAGAVRVAAAVVDAHARSDAELAVARSELAARELEARAAAEAWAEARRAVVLAAEAARSLEASGDVAAEAAARQQLSDLALAEAEADRSHARALAVRDAALRSHAARAATAEARAHHATASAALGSARAGADAARAAVTTWEALAERVSVEADLARVASAEAELAGARGGAAEAAAAKAAAAARLVDARGALGRADEAVRGARAAVEALGTDEGRSQLLLVAERARRHVEALREAHQRAAAAGAAAALAAATATEAAELAEGAARAAAGWEGSRAELAEWEGLETAIDAHELRAAAAVARAQRAARSRAVAEADEAAERVAALTASRARLVVPDRATLSALRSLQAELEGARRALSVGITLQITPRQPVKLTLRADGAPGLSFVASSPIELEARASAILDLPDATVTVTGGGKDALDRVTALEGRAAAELAPVLSAAGAVDLAGLEAAAERAAALDRELDLARAQAASAGRAVEALPEPDGEALARAEALPAPDPRVPAGPEPRAHWRKRREELATVAARASAVAADAKTRAALAAARAAAAAAAVPAPEVPPEPLAPAEEALVAAEVAVAASERTAAERRAAAAATLARVTAELDAARAAESEADAANAAAGATVGRRDGEVASAEAALAALGPDRVRARAAALGPPPAGWSGSTGWDRGLEVRRETSRAAEAALAQATTALALATQALARAESDPAGQSGDDPSLPAAEDALGTAAGRLQAATAALARARAAAETRQGARARDLTSAKAASEAAEAAQAAAERAASEATAALGRAQGRVATLAGSVPPGEREGALRHLAELKAAAGEVPTADERARADLHVAQTRAAAEVAEATFQRLQGALDQVGGTVAEERLAEADAAVRLARARESEVQTESEAWKLLRDTLLAAERDQAANLGGVLGPWLSDRLRELAGPRYERVLLAPHLRAEGVVVGGATRATEALSVGTREQLATLLRLCLAERLGTMVVLDDQLTQTDPGRLDWFGRALLEVGAKVQVLVFTCRPGDYPPPGEGVNHLDLGVAIERAP
jgi:hypothetical protein